MLFSLTYGEMRVKRSPLKTWSKVQANTRLDMRRSGSVENKLNSMGCNTFGINTCCIYVAITRLMPPSLGVFDVRNGSVYRNIAKRSVRRILMGKLVLLGIFFTLDCQRWIA
jgi:hypothetical protein